LTLIWPLSSNATVIVSERLASNCLSSVNMFTPGNFQLLQVDLFGFSFGGMVAQQITLDRPELVRTLEDSYLLQKGLTVRFRLKKCDAMGILCPPP
jgi:alpha/beta superfamily hydrolase